MDCKPAWSATKTVEPEAVKALHQSGMELKGQLSLLRQTIQGMISEAVNFPEMPWLVVQEVLGRLAWLDKPLANFAEASKVADLGKLELHQSSATN